MEISPLVLIGNISVNHFNSLEMISLHMCGDSKRFEAKMKCLKSILVIRKVITIVPLVTNSFNNRSGR